MQQKSHPAPRALGWPLCEESRAVGRSALLIRLSRQAWMGPAPPPRTPRPLSAWNSASNAGGDSGKGSGGLVQRGAWEETGFSVLPLLRLFLLGFHLSQSIGDAALRKRRACFRGWAGDKQRGRQQRQPLCSQAMLLSRCPGCLLLLLSPALNLLSYPVSGRSELLQPLLCVRKVPGGGNRLRQLACFRRPRSCKAFIFSSWL